VPIAVALAAADGSLGYRFDPRTLPWSQGIVFRP
jgi:hypothetical protein